MLIKPHSNEIKNFLEAWLMLIVFNLRSNYLTINLLRYKCFCNHERSYQSIWKKTYHIHCQIMLINDHRHHWQLLITRWKKQFLT